MHLNDLSLTQIPRRTIPEWGETLLEGVSLSSRDQKLAEQLRGGEGRLLLEEWKQGLFVKATSWVGVVRGDNFEIRITPKLSGGDASLVHMLSFTNGFESLRRNLGKRFLDAEKDGGLLDLLAHLLTEACNRLTHQGLLYDYIDEEEALPFMRGRLQITPQIRRRLGTIHLLECTFDDHSSDILENRILAAALLLSARKVRNTFVRQQVHQTAAFFASICRPELFRRNDLEHELTFHRLNTYYRPALELARLILLGLGIENLLASDKTSSFAFLLDMNALFEKFIFRYLERLINSTPYQLKFQFPEKATIFNYFTRQPYTSIRPDFLLYHAQHPSINVALDAKYKQYDNRAISTGDIYQAFLYAYAFSQNFQPHPEAFIIYPATGRTQQTARLQIRNASQYVGGELHILGVYLPQMLEEMETRQLDGPTANFMREAIFSSLERQQESNF